MSYDSGQINYVGVNQRGLLQHTFANLYNGMWFSLTVGFHDVPTSAPKKLTCISCYPQEQCPWQYNTAGEDPSL